MFVIVGLGNPEKKYFHTRHNVGFDCIDALSDKYGIELTETKFKAAYGKSLENMDRILQKFCPEMDESRRLSFRLVFFPFMFGIYPYAAVTEKQRSAMEQAGVDFRYCSIYELTLACLLRLLG